MRRIARLFAGPVMVLLGLNHFVFPQTYATAVPDALGAQLALVYLSGAAEIAGGLGTMHARTRRAAGWLLEVTLIAIYPANVHMAIHPDRYPGVPGGSLTLVARLPLQILFIYWVWIAAFQDDSTSREHMG
ncbi:MAG: hypothetical protein M3360_03415 [Actinomycetota bacterium]|nr:hypothetical protein [Actinomycetota bacterium]